jgi:hypothetical protein
MIDVIGIGHQPGNRFSMPGNDDFLAAFDPIEQGAKGIFGLKGADFPHANSNNLI